MVTRAMEEQIVPPWGTLAAGGDQLPGCGPRSNDHRNVLDQQNSPFHRARFGQCEVVNFNRMDTFHDVQQAYSSGGLRARNNPFEIGSSHLSFI